MPSVPIFIQSLLETAKMQNHRSRRWIMFRIEYAAFDTIDHNILLERMTEYVVRGMTLDWFIC